MTVFNATRIALYALGRNKLRSALTALGIIIGVGSLIALLGIGHGARAEVEKQVASLGENVIQVSAGSISKSAVKLGLGSSVALTVEDAEAVEEEVPDAVAVSPEVKIKTQVVSGNRNWSTEIYGNSTDYFTIRQWRTSQGEIFTEQDVRGATKVAVIGQEAAEQLFGEDEDPIGEINVGHSASAVSSFAVPVPIAMPIKPPKALNVTASMRNCRITSRRCAPMAMRRPISRVRSVTLTSMMFMMPMPPTTSDTLAMRASRMVIARAVAVADSAISSWLRTLKSSSLPASMRWR